MKISATTPQGLWRAWRTRRDPGAFESLVRPELRHAASLARRMGASEAEADDAVQESLLRLAEETSDDPVRVGVRAWLCRRVALGYKMHVRASVRRRRHEGRVSPRPPPAAPLRRLEVRDRVESALARLADPEREAVLLRYLEDLDYAEMAYVLGISEGACRVRVHRGIRRLRRLLGPRAAALVPLIGLPALTTEAAMVSTAVGSAAATGISGAAGILGGKVAAKLAAAVLVVGAATTGALVLDEDEPEKPPVEMASVGPPAAHSAVAVTPPARPIPPTRPEPWPRFASAIDMMDSHLAGEKDATRHLWRFDEVARLVARPAGKPHRIEATGEVTEVDIHEISGRAARIEFGPGTFRLTSGIGRPRTEALEIVGSGKDRTTLLAPTHDLLHVVAGSTMPGLVVRDLTFEAFGKQRTSPDFLGVRGRAVALLERVRFGNWYPWAGGGSPIIVSEQAVLAFRDCEFRGAWNQGGGGNALAVRGDVLALFDRCLFSDLDQVVSSHAVHVISPRSLIHFNECRFVNARLTNNGFLNTGDPLFPLRVRGARISWGSPRMSDGRRLQTWTAGAVAEATQVRWSPAEVRGTLGEIMHVLNRYREPPGERIVYVRKVAWPDWKHAGFVLRTQDGEGRLRDRLLRVRGEGTRGTIHDEGEVVFPRSFRIRLEPDEADLRQSLRSAPSLMRPGLPYVGVYLRRRTNGEMRIHTYPSSLYRQHGIVVPNVTIRIGGKKR